MPHSKTQAIREQIAKLVDEYAAITYAPKTFTPDESVVPPSGKALGAEELKLMVEASLDGWLTTGALMRNLKKSWLLL